MNECTMRGVSGYRQCRLSLSLFPCVGVLVDTAVVCHFRVEVKVDHPMHFAEQFFCPAVLYCAVLYCAHMWRKMHILLMHRLSNALGNFPTSVKPIPCRSLFMQLGWLGDHRSIFYRSGLCYGFSVGYE